MRLIDKFAAYGVVPILFGLIYWFYFYQSGALMPGDHGDTREIAWCLEHIYRWLNGQDVQLIHPAIFYPNRFMAFLGPNPGFDSVVYIALRAIGADKYTAFTFWYLAAHCANAIAMSWILRRFGFSLPAVIAGAAIYAHALPVSSFGFHPAYVWRFGLPFVFYFTWRFLEIKRLSALSWAIFWMAVQLFSAIYIGAFSAMIMVVMFLTGRISWVTKRTALETGAPIATMLCDSWKKFANKRQRLLSVGLLLIGLSLILVLGAAFLSLSARHSFYTSPDYLAALSPRLFDYIAASHSLLWNWMNVHDVFPVPEPFNHNLFIGLIPLLLSLYMLMTIPQERKSLRAISVILIGFFFLLTLNVYSIPLRLNANDPTNITHVPMSIWTGFFLFPGFNIIRYTVRIVLLFLVPIALLSAMAITNLEQKMPLRYRKPVIVTLLLLLLGEMLLIEPYRKPRTDWVRLDRHVASFVPNDLKPDAILAFAKHPDILGPDPYYTPVVISMMNVAADLGLSLMNGYHANSPTGYRFTQSCRDIPINMIRGLRTEGQLTQENYTAHMARVVPVGYDDCDPDWWRSIPFELEGQRPETRYEKIRRLLRPHFGY